MQTNKHADLILPQNPTLSDLQTYVQQLEDVRGFSQTTSNVQCALQLGEEIGEVFKAIRKAEKGRTDPRSTHYHIAEELADILIYVNAIANRYSINLEQAFRDKEEINKKRTWS